MLHAQELGDKMFNFFIPQWFESEWSLSCFCSENKHLFKSSESQISVSVFAIIADVHLLRPKMLSEKYYLKFCAKNTDGVKTCWQYCLHIRYFILFVLTFDPVPYSFWEKTTFHPFIKLRKL